VKIISKIIPRVGTASSSITIYGTNLASTTEIDFYDASNTIQTSIPADFASPNGTYYHNIIASRDGTQAQFIVPSEFAYAKSSATQLRIITPVGVSNSFPFSIIYASDVTMLKASADPSEPPASQIVMGSKGNTLAAFRFAEISNKESLKIRTLVVTQIVSSSIISPQHPFSKLTLYVGDTAVATSSGFGFTYTKFAWQFDLVNPIIVPQAGFVILTLKGDILPCGSVGATETSTHIFEIRGVDAIGATHGTRKPSFLDGTWIHSDFRNHQSVSVGLFVVRRVRNCGAKHLAQHLGGFALLKVENGHGVGHLSTTDHIRDHAHFARRLSETT